MMDVPADTKPQLNTGHAIEYLERVYMLQQIVEATIDTHPMAHATPGLHNALASLTDAVGVLYQAAGNALIEMEDAEA